MSPDEAALCEAAHRSRAAANVATRSAVEAAVDAAVKEASEFVAENAVEYRRLKVRFARVRRRGSDMQYFSRFQAQSEELERCREEALQAGGYSSLEVLRSEAEQLKADVEEMEDDLRQHIGTFR